MASRVSAYGITVRRNDPVDAPVIAAYPIYGLCCKRCSVFVAYPMIINYVKVLHGVDNLR
jgi:hypothetical protein